jgi:transglutaminase-like putative cysteine protease
MDEVKKKKTKKIASTSPELLVGVTGSSSRWGGWMTWLNIIFLFLALGIAIYSIEQAHWITRQPSLTLVLVLAIAATRLLTVTRLPGWCVHVLLVFTGLLVTVWQGISILPEASGVGEIFTIFAAWMRGGAGMPAGEQQAIFGILLVFLTWMVSYLSTWFILRRHNAWVAVCLGLVIIIINLTNLLDKTYLFFTLYLLAAVLLIIETRIAKQQSAARIAVLYSGKSLFYLIISLFCITVLAATLSWVTPQLRWPSLQTAIATAMPWKNSVEESSLNILGAVPSKKAIATASTIQSLSFGKTWNESEEIRYTVYSEQPAYWQVNVYDTYESDSWSSNVTEEDLRERRTSWDNTEDPAGQSRLQYRVVTRLDTDIMLLTGDYVSSDIPALVSIGVDGEVVGAKTPRMLIPGENYIIRTYVADASADSLNGTAGKYDDAIKSVYLQLPDSFPEDVRQLSENITAGAKTPYEKVMALDAYLAKIPYNKEVDALPEGADAVENFLFTQKKGFCLHFASAMTTMLRSVGVPARLAVGFLPGDPGENYGEYILRDKHYHAWTQVYFPGHGWINFEPTPGGTGATESPADSNTPLISTPRIREFGEWEVWEYPLGQFPGESQTMPSYPTETQDATPHPLPFADELGKAVVIILGALVVFGLIYGLARAIRPLYSRQIWKVDRENMASSVYTSLCRLVYAVRLMPAPQETPLEFSVRIAEYIPEQSRELRTIIQSYLDNRFGPVKGKPELYEEAEILKARVTLFNAILLKRGNVQRFFNKYERD